MLISCLTHANLPLTSWAVAIPTASPKELLVSSGPSKRLEHHNESTLCFRPVPRLSPRHSTTSHGPRSACLPRDSWLATTGTGSSCYDFFELGTHHLGGNYVHEPCFSWKPHVFKRRGSEKEIETEGDKGRKKGRQN